MVSPRQDTVLSLVLDSGGVFLGAKVLYHTELFITHALLSLGLPKIRKSETVTILTSEFAAVSVQR